jgi:hypothetical protein
MTDENNCRPCVPNTVDTPMSDSTQRLCELFANVPDGSEDVGKGGGRIHSADFVPDIEGPIDNPRDWLARYMIPIREVPRVMLAGDAAAIFKHASRGGEFIQAEVWIPKGADINKPDVRWHVWHEVGHAVDFVFTRENKIIATPHGQFSTNHIAVLRRHQEQIIQWSPHPDRAYKTKPVELWAECVACAILSPERMPAELFAAISPDLHKRNLPLRVAPAE